MLQSYEDCISTSQLAIKTQLSIFRLLCLRSRPSIFFFDPITTSLGRVSIENMLLADDELSNKPAVLSDVFGITGVRFQEILEAPLTSHLNQANLR